MILKMRLLPLISLLLWVLSIISVLADTPVNFHEPNKDEYRIIRAIFLQSDYKDDFLRYERGELDDDGHAGVADIYISRVNLDKSKNGEMAIMFDGVLDGNAGASFQLWKNVSGKWVNLLSDYLEFGGPFYITPRIVNGFRVLRFYDSPYERVFDGSTYICPTCPN